MRTLRNCFALSIFSIAIAVAVFSCGQSDDEKDKEEDSADTDGTSDSGDDSPSTGSLALDLKSVPQLTEPVQAYATGVETEEATAAASFNSLAVSSGLRLMAENGVSLGDSAEDILAKFEEASNVSKNFCEATNRTLKFLQDASAVDTMQCILKGMYGDDDDLLDGEDHITNLTFGSNSNLKMKFNISGSNDALSTFTSHICRDGEQIMYFNVSVDGDEITMKSLRETPGGSAPSCSDTKGMVLTTVTSNLNDEGHLVGLKNIEIKNNTICNTDDEVARFQGQKITQSDKNILLSSWQNEKGEKNSFYFFSELLDQNTSADTYALGNLALGDGAGIMTIFSNDAQGWDGDNLSIDADAAQLIKVEDVDLPEAPSSEETIAFTGDMAWDCAGTAEKDGDLDQDVYSACSERYDLDQDPLDCQTL